MNKNGQLLKNAECFVFDLDGTVYIGGKLIDGAKETIDYLRKTGKKVIFLTNNCSVSKEYYVKKINAIGIDVEEKDVYTAGNATIRYLNLNHKGKTVYLVGTNALKEEFIKGGITVVEDKPDIVCVSYDKEINYEKLVKATRFLTQGALYIATHPDINCPAEPVYEPDVGALMALIEKSCKKTPSVICGKPYKPIADGIAEFVGVDFDKIAMVGDRITTDIAFGVNNGLIATMVLSGESTEKDVEITGIIPNVILNSIKDIPNYLK
ncbi:MAG: HAD-IIA family hydrolase [Clostridia bacterium]|nr:HAD-IIA family hydrolase [Clostridia bacterium]